MNALFRFIAVSLILLTGNLYAQNKALSDFVRSANLQHAGIGIRIVNISDGKTLCNYNENLSLCPASCLKLVTTATALEKYGDQFAYQTTVFTDGTIAKDGQLDGNIYIQGSGDPTLGSEYVNADAGQEAFLNQWLTDIRKTGIKSVTGSVVVLDNLFGYEGVSPYWPWVDIANYYAPGIYGISVFDNLYRLYLKSGKAGTTPEILRTEPSISSLHFENHLKAANNSMDSAYIYGMPFNYERRLFGTIPQNRPSFVIKGDLPDPGYFLADCFTAFLSKNNIRVTGKASTFRLTPITPKKIKILSVTNSPPLAEIVKVVNFRSNNHYAECLFRKMQTDGNTGTPAKDYWSKQGLKTDGLFMYDGSGLSPMDGLNVKFMTDLLVYMQHKSGYKEAFYASLPTAGKAGTVSSFLKGTPLEGIARAKSGSIKNVRAYCGYFDKGKNRYAFAILINNYNSSKNSSLVKQIEQLLVGVFNDA